MNHGLLACSTSFSCFSVNKQRDTEARKLQPPFRGKRALATLSFENYSLAGVKWSVGLSTVSPNQADQTLPTISMCVLSSVDDPTIPSL